MVEAAVELFKLAYGAGPWLLVPALGLLAWLASRVPRDAYSQIGAGLLEFAKIAIAVYQEYEMALERVEQMMPLVPGWDELAAVSARRDVLARACLYHLARTNSGTLSAVELSDHLPDIYVGKSAQPIRETMRLQLGCSQPYQGRWQVGKPLPGTF